VLSVFHAKPKTKFLLQPATSNSSQGFPWLLKKLYINLYEGMSKGEGSKSLPIDLDAERLFQSDLDSLSSQEMTCLKLVAQKAPADWSEIIEISGKTTKLKNSTLYYTNF
jgi:hypothetical protein